MKARKGEANMENSGKVTPAERKSMSPITRFLESDHARSPSTCSGTLEKSPRSNAGAEHPHTDASSPAAAFSRSVTSEENLIQDLENCWDILNRKAQEVEQKCPSNDTLEMCVSEREREELSGLTNWEGSSGTGFGDWKAKGLVKNKNESQRNQRQQKLSIALPLGAFSPPQSSSTPKHPGHTFGATPNHSGRAEVAVVRPTQVVSERVEEDQLIKMLEKEELELDVRLQACKQRRLNELLKRVVVRVKEEVKDAVIEQLVEDTAQLVEYKMYS